MNRKMEDEVAALRKSKVPWECGDETDWEERLPKDVKILLFDALDSFESFMSLRAVSKRYWKASAASARWNPTLRAQIILGQKKAAAELERLKRERRMRFYRPFVKHKCCCFLHLILVMLCLTLLVFGAVFLPLGFTPSFYEGAVDWRDSSCLLDRDSAGNLIVKLIGCFISSVSKVMRFGRFSFTVAALEVCSASIGGLLPPLMQVALI